MKRFVLATTFLFSASGFAGNYVELTPGTSVLLKAKEEAYVSCKPVDANTPKCRIARALKPGYSTVYYYEVYVGDSKTPVAFTKDDDILQTLPIVRTLREIGSCY